MLVFDSKHLKLGQDGEHDERRRPSHGYDGQDADNVHPEVVGSVRRMVWVKQPVVLLCINNIKQLLKIIMNLIS